MNSIDHPREAEPARLRQTANQPPVFDARDGAVFHRGVYTRQDVCERLLAILKADASDPCDYYRANAQRLVEELEQAMQAAGYFERSMA